CPEGNSKWNRDQHRGDTQFCGGRKELAEVIEDGSMGVLRRTKVAVYKPLQVEDILNRHRLIKAILVPERRHDGWVPQSLLGQIRGGRIAGNDLRERK